MDPVRATAKGGAILDGYMSESSLMQRPFARSESEPHWFCMTVFLRRCDLSIDSETEAEP